MSLSRLILLCILEKAGLYGTEDEKNEKKRKRKKEKPATTKTSFNVAPLKPEVEIGDRTNIRSDRNDAGRGRNCWRTDQV